MDLAFRPIVLPKPTRLRRLRWVWIVLVIFPLYWLIRNWQPLPLAGVLMCAAGLWIWLVVTDHKPPYGLLFSEDGELGVALSASQMDSFQTAPKATLVGSQFFEHWIALQIRLDNHASPADARFKAKKRKKLFLLLSGADAWNDDDWRVLRVRLLHLKNPQVAG